MLLVDAFLLSAAIWYFQSRKKEQNAISAPVGSNGPISQFLASLQLHLASHANAEVAKGYLQNRTGVFRLPKLFSGWLYVVCGKRRVQEIASAPNHILSFDEGLEDFVYTLGPEIVMNPYHASAVRGSMTRNLGRRFPDVRDEIVHAFDDVLALKGPEWKLVQVHPALLQIVARTSNRLFVGLPLCREPEYLQLNIDFTISVFARGQLISTVPYFLKPILGPILSKRKSSLRHILKFVGPMLKERLEKENIYGHDWPGRPNDLISWLLEIAEDSERTAPALAMRLLTVNFTAIHTSATALTVALYDLTAHAEHIEPMREEVERVISLEGWTKGALEKMHKVDSFLRESQRLTALSPVVMHRKVVAKEGFTFSDGTTVPHGATLTVPITVHRDHGLADSGVPSHGTDVYPQAEVFDGFRVARMHSKGLAELDDAGEGTRTFNRHMVSTDPEHLVFGHGRHACPGRFFAATELKAMLAHILINYDIRAEREGLDGRPKDVVFGMFGSPSASGKVWFRQRKREGM
ncbi:cytochrome P450 [Mycena pura]|uniref:Cytochrome P450 n=1 Tax=Mycena pura TaxID=153505 RepID=A0AAD6V7K3_9AGAR|nr:cytochrome P450 [Mycena pura]